MTSEHLDGPRWPIPLGEAFEKLGDYYTNQHGPGSADDGWARLQRVLGADEPTAAAAEPAPGRWQRLADRVQSWWDRVTVKYWVASVLMVIGVAYAGADGVLEVFAAAVAVSCATALALSALLQSARRQEAEAKAAKVLQEHRREMRIQIARRDNARRRAAERHLVVQTVGRTDKAGIIHLSSVDLRDHNLAEFNLIGAALEEATLDGMNLCGANLYGATLTGSSMFGTELSRADLTRPPGRHRHRYRRLGELLARSVS
ncbi:pentapeptide repeat-containing protein [Nocardia fusca]|uniref:pentapeptide repeat-containing protein n=1 Tax=Nocardia fusca TaxID=941183 RepID=UPI0037C85CD6